MIPLIGKNKVRKVGFIKGYHFKEDYPIIPAISPGIQGARAYDLLTDEQKSVLGMALKDTARRYKCRPRDIRWAFGRSVNGVSPLKIWPPKKPTIIDRIRKNL